MFSGIVQCSIIPLNILSDAGDEPQVIRFYQPGLSIGRDLFYQLLAGTKHLKAMLQTDYADTICKINIKQLY